MKSPQKQRPVKYHGLLNLGATCYLNSVLQVLFMTEDFRETVTRNKAGKEHIDSDLCDLFNKLKEDHAHTDTIRQRLKIKNVYEQRDAAEHYEKILRLTSPEASQIFHGKMINRSTCKKCNTQTESEAGFWHLPLPLVHSEKNYSVEKGIEDFFHPSEISGENQMYCEKCDEKCDAVLDCEVKHHPEVLVLLLKRFEFDYSYMTYIKINRAVIVPDRLQTPQDQSYKLYALVEHCGDLRKGHYISKIQSLDDEKWYIFDDLNVTESEYKHFQLDSTERSKTAYLLFYKKEKGADSQSPTEEEEQGQNVKNEAEVKNKPVRAAPKRGTLPVDSEQGDENTEQPCHKKQKEEKKVDQEDMQKSNININGEEKIASSKVLSYTRVQENDYKKANIEILEYDSKQRAGRSKSERRHFSSPYEDDSNVIVNAKYGRQTSLDMQTQMKTNVSQDGQREWGHTAVKTPQAEVHSSDLDRLYNNSGNKCVSQKGQDHTNIGAHGFDEHKRRTGNDTLTDESGYKRQHTNNVRPDPGLSSVRSFVRQKDDVYQDNHRNIRDTYQLDMRGRRSLKFDRREQRRGNTRSEGNPNIKPMGSRHSFHGTPTYPSQDYQLENFRRQVGQNRYYMGRERPKEETDYAQQFRERSQQKGPGSGQTEQTSKSQRNQRRHEDSEEEASKRSQSRVDHSQSSLNKNSPRNKCHDPDMKRLSAEAKVEEQRREGGKKKGSDSRRSNKGSNRASETQDSVTEELEYLKEDKFVYKTRVKKSKSKWNWLHSCLPLPKHRSKNRTCPQ